MFTAHSVELEMLGSIKIHGLVFTTHDVEHKEEVGIHHFWCQVGDVKSFINYIYNLFSKITFKVDFLLSLN